MSSERQQFKQRKKCKDFENNHKKSVYETKRNQFKKLQSMAEKLQPLFPDIILQPEDEICNYCYNKLSNRIAEKEKLSPSTSEDFSSAVPAVNSDLSLLSSNSSDKSFVPKTNPQDIEKLNAELQIHTSTVSPLKYVSEVDIRWRVNYVSRKRKEIAEIQDSRLLRKMKTLYDIAENEELNFPTSEISNCQLCVNWFENFGSSLENCTSYTEKIRLLSAAPICQMPKNLIFSKWPHVTDHMVRKARLIVTEKGNYSTPDPYSGHPIDENVRKVALEYYLNDDLSCSSQSPNKNDSINVYENDVKVVKIKRYMTRSIYETYQMFKQDHSDLKIGHSKFYDLRPKWVVTSPAKQVCLCIYCTNFDLLLVGLKNCLNRYGVIVMNVREIVLSAGVCSVENDACVFKECVECPGIDGIIRKISEFLKDEIQEEMTYAFWEGNDLIKKTTTIEIFIKTLSEWTLKVNTHLQCKEIQQNGIRLEKEISKQNSSHLILHIDFAENWSVIVQNEVQSYHWKSKQISIFTAVCYFGQNTESYVVVTDDLSHDSAHALLAIDKIVSDINQRFPNIVTQSMTIISDGAPSHFKNRFQLDEFKTMKLQRKWLFSATGHGKGACDGIGGLVKHFATRHNLSVDETQYIQSAQAFVEIVQMKTPKIRHILLEVNELEGFREKKKKSWKKIQAYKGVREKHVWKN